MSRIGLGVCRGCPGSVRRLAWIERAVLGGVLAVALSLSTGCGEDKPLAALVLEEPVHARLLDDASRREYEATHGKLGLQAPNRAQGFRTYFDSAGIRVEDRTAAEPLLELRLEALARDDRRIDIGRGTVSSQGARVSVRRPHVDEWFVNSPRGLEHGFAIAERPQGGGDLRVIISVEGATARATAGSHGIVLATDDGRELRYDDAHASDASGRRVPIRLEAFESEIQLVLADAGATYPVVVDPLLSSPGWVIQSNQALAAFGSSVSSAGDVNGDGFADYIVGAPGYDAGEGQAGAAFLYAGRSESSLPPLFMARIESDQADARLGESVSGAGDVNGDGYADVIMGAPYYDAPESDEGAAFLFLGEPTGIATASVTAAAAQLESNTPGSRFGASVAAEDADGDGFSDAIVGAPYHNAGGALSGSVFIYHSAGSAGIGDEAGGAPDIVGGGGSPYFLGSQVGGGGDLNGDGYGDVFARAYPEIGPRVYVFHGSATGISATVNTASATLAFSSLSPSAWPAAAGDVNGDAYSDLIVGLTLSGGDAAYVFHGGPGGIGNGGPLTADTQLLGPAGFGTRVAGVGDLTGDGYADVAVSGADQVFVYLGRAGGIPSGQSDSADRSLQGVPGSDFARALCGAGDVNGDGFADLLVGAPSFTFDQSEEGAAYLYLGGGFGLTATTDFAVHSDQNDALLGASIAGAGDVNGDGFSDVLVGAPAYDAGQTDEGIALVLLGSASGIGTFEQAQRLQVDLTGAEFGRSVAGAGDVNGDGYADVIVGAPGVSRAYVFAGGVSGIASEGPPTATLSSAQGGSRFGASVAGVGDVDGDGFADVVVGAPLYDSDEIDEGAAFVFLGGADGIPTVAEVGAAATCQADYASSQLGTSVAGAGDVDGDGFADLIVGAPLYGGQLEEGIALIYRGGETGLSCGAPAAAWARIETSFSSGGRLGTHVAAAGDRDGDGNADVIVSAPGYPDYGIGDVFLITGAALREDQSQDSIDGSELGLFNPRSVSGAGDVDGDGLADVVVGSIGGAAALTTSQGRVSLFNPNHPSFPAYVVGVGDVNGDGFGDVLMSIPDSGAGGSIRLFLGNGNRHGTRAWAQQQASPLSARIPPWGASTLVADAFAVQADVAHPVGSGSLALEVQACAAGVPFGAPSCTTRTTGWFDATPNSLRLEVDGLLPATLYRWRARALFAARGAGANGVTAPPRPAHGPWRRLYAQATAADVRTRPYPDADRDGVPDASDNCPLIANPGQSNLDGDSLGDACDPDPDGDGIAAGDNCPVFANVGQQDADGDAAGDYCDPCPFLAGVLDPDQDGRCGAADLCPTVRDEDASDLDMDGSGDACDPDRDGDDVYEDGSGSGISGDLRCSPPLLPINCDDNCPATWNPLQTDDDDDSLGDDCDSDTSATSDTPQFGQTQWRPLFRFLFEPESTFTDYKWGDVGSGICTLQRSPDAPAIVSVIFEEYPDAEGVACCAWEMECRDQNSQSVNCPNYTYEPYPNVDLNPTDPRRAFGVSMFGITDFSVPVYSDGDVFPDQCDNCDYVANNDQADSDGDGIGDACECGDVAWDGRIAALDVQLLRDVLVGHAALPDPEKCNVRGVADLEDDDMDGAPNDCNLLDWVAMRNVIAGRYPTSVPTQVCAAAQP